MEQILIPEKRAKILLQTKVEVEKILECKLEVVDECTVIINGDAYNEYNARNVIQAFGRGFPLDKAYKLLSEDYFFKYINMKDLFKNESQIKRIKARVIGTEGRTKEYVEEVSGAIIFIYGNTIGIIGKASEINIAEAALNALIEGSTHKKAYRVMEAARKKTLEEE